MISRPFPFAFRCIQILPETDYLLARARMDAAAADSDAPRNLRYTTVLGAALVRGSTPFLPALTMPENGLIHPITVLKELKSAKDMRPEAYMENRPCKKEIGTNE